MPFILDQRFPDDTLFWVCEEDFRFWPPGEDPDGADTYFEKLAALIKHREESGSTGSSLPPTRKGKGKRKPSLPPESEYHTVRSKGHSDESELDQGFSRDVVDMMRIATMCSRNKMGHLIWVSWVPQKNKPSRIGHGTQCLMLTKEGAFAIQAAKDKGLLKKGHIDLELKDWLLKDGEAEEAQACYLYPPIGNYTEHASECDPTQFGGDKTRPSGFDSGENPCHGTRRSGDPKSRPKFMVQWRPGWQDRPWIPFEKESVLHETDQYHWRSAEFTIGAAMTRDEALSLPSNPGTTKREKRMFRDFMNKMNKRNWVPPDAEAECVVWGAKFVRGFSA